MLFRLASRRSPHQFTRCATTSREVAPTGQLHCSTTSVIYPLGSSFSGPTSPALLNTTYHNLITEQIAEYPHKDCFRNTAEDSKYSFKQLLVCQITNVLKSC